MYLICFIAFEFEASNLCSRYCYQRLATHTCASRRYQVCSESNSIRTIHQGLQRSNLRAFASWKKLCLVYCSFPTPPGKYFALRPIWSAL